MKEKMGKDPKKLKITKQLMSVSGLIFKKIE